MTPTRPGSTYYLNGVQSIGSDYELGSMSIRDDGRSQANQRLYTPTSNSMTIDRIMSNYTNETTRITGPLLHYIHTANSSYPQATGPASYRAGYLPSLNGVSTTGSASDILQYDIELLYQQQNDILNTSKAISSLKFRRALLTGVSYAISTGGYLREGTTFSSKNIEVGSGSYTKLPVTTGTTNAGKFIKTIRSHHFNYANSALPTELLEVIDNNTFVDGKEITGLTEISTDVAFGYIQGGDQGKWLGSSDTTEANLWTTAQFPFEISCSFTFTARKSIDTAIYNRPNNFSESSIRLVFDCMNYDGTSGNAFVINLGKKNYLQSISISGGSTSGDLVEYTYKYVNSNNDFLTYFNNVGNYTAANQTTERY